MKKIVIFTRQYPYTNNSENFLDSELVVIKEKYDVLVVPFSKQFGCNKKRINVTVSNSCCESSLWFKIDVVMDMLFSVFLWKCFIIDGFWSINGSKHKIYYLKNLYGSFFIRRIIRKRKIEFDNDTIFYSYWLTYAPFGLCMLKKDGDIVNKIVSRTHGYEIYELREGKDKGVHFPFRKFTYSVIDEIYSISTFGATLLKMKYPIWKDKFKVSRLGVSKQCFNKPSISNQKPFTVVSCSYLYLLKRVDLIFESLCNYCMEYNDIEIHWIHIGTSRGDKEELSFDKLANLITDKPKNLQVSLLGKVENKDILEIYRANNCNLFINLSTSEGIPVSIMEALSMNIPIIATDVGGTSEIVNEDTGYLLDVDFEQYTFNCAMNYIIEEYERLCNAIPGFFNDNYYMEKNYTDFYSKISK